MPVYCYVCRECGKATERLNKIDERRTNAPICAEHGPMDIDIRAAMVHWKHYDINYRCPVTREQVTSWKQRNELFAKHDLMDMNDVKNEPPPSPTLSSDIKEELRKVAQQMAPD